MAHPEGSAVKVVGFKVNGGSPESIEMTPSTDVSLHSGSPLPVSIPPPFNRTPRAQRSDPPFTGLRAKSDTTTGSVLDADPDPSSSELTRQIHPTLKNDPPPKSHPKATPSKEPRSGNPSKKSPKPKKSPGTEKGNDKTARQGVPCVALFDHLDPFRPFNRETTLRKGEAAELDPYFLQFCIRYAEGDLHESKACAGFLQSCLESLSHFQNDASLFYTREYLSFLNQRIGFLTQCRSLNIALRNSIRILKVEVTKLKSGVAMEEGRDAIRRVIQSFLEERVEVSHIIAQEASSLIQDQDVILTYSASETVLAVLEYAWCQQGKRFRVVVVDSRPECDAKRCLLSLTALHIPCSYLFIHALGYALKDVSKVLMGASAVLSNGTVVSRAGSASVAMMAHVSHIPTVICCQTLKFHERVQLDSFTHNELGDPSALQSTEGEIGREHPYLSLLNVRYDLMPAAFVSIVVSELGMIPASSVSVVLREQQSDREMT